MSAVASMSARLDHTVDEPPAVPRLPRTVVFVEASSGGVVGGSLTGLLQQIRGMGPEWRRVLALYEPKSIETALAEQGVPVVHVPRWRVPKQHRFQGSEAYRAVRRSGALRGGLGVGRLLLRTVAEELPAALALARVIRANRATVVHLGNGVRANFDGVMACWLTRTPCVCHVKGFEKYGWRERWASTRIDAIVCMTHAIETHCEEGGVRAPRMHVVYDALDPEHFRPARAREAVREELGLSADRCAVGIIGGIQEWKGQAVVIEAIARARRTHPELRCLIVGGVHRAGRQYAEMLRQRVRALGAEEIVSFIGLRHDVPDILNALDIVVHASVRPEPFGRVILEAMMLGRPVIAAAAGGVTEFVDEDRTGLLVPPGDVAALAAAIAALAADPARRRRIGQQAQVYARERFSISEHVRAMTTIYDAITMRH